MTFLYNDPDILGQTVFIKRGPHQGALGMVKKQVAEQEYEVTGGDFGDELVRFSRKEFVLYRHRKIKIDSKR